ncbi:hypothetical protein [Euzebya tangerina]|uniref:hypothetical protein n=1 Tax=Euzebya tangerina TaxID=591198 RepID=UPI000E31D032|nr:hypothetical protein [Euzebya tangerina]
MTAIEDRSLRDRFFTPAVSRAITAPSSLLLLGGAAAVGIVAGGPVIGAVLGVGAYAGKVWRAIPRRGRAEQIDPRSLRSPWRDYVHETQIAQARYRRVVEQAQEGPLTDRLEQIGERIGDGVRQAWGIAKRGQALEDGLHQLEVNQAQRELKRTLEEVQRHPTPSNRQRLESLQSQVATAQRLQRVTTDASERLRLLDARLDEAVARAVELSLSGDTGQLSGLGSDVDSLVGEMEALRQALEETGGTTAQMGVT